MTKISVAIPCYEMGGKGAEILEFSFNKLIQQSFRDFETVITDHSQNDEIKNLYDSWKDIINVKYFRNEEHRGSPTQNTNMSIKKSEGKIIKILCQDDYLLDAQSLQIIADEFIDGVNWMATSYIHTNDRQNFFNKHVPTITEDIIGNNKLGTPSAYAIRNGVDIWFDENLVYYYDADFYKMMIKKFGNPKIVDKITMVNYIWGGQVTNTIATQDLRNRELQYLRGKNA